MRDFYRADQGEEETIPSFATRMEGLLSQIRDRFPNQLPLQEEQRLLRDCLFHGSRKNITDSIKYCSPNASIDYSPLSWEPLLSPKVKKGQQGQGATKTNKPSQCWQCGEVKHLKRDCPTLKGEGLFQGGMHEQPSGTEKAFPK